VQWPGGGDLGTSGAADETASSDDDPQAERIGHAAARYGNYLYIFGGCTMFHRYKADVFRLAVGAPEYRAFGDINPEAARSSNGARLAWQVGNDGGADGAGCAYEACEPRRQSYEQLVHNMMTPRAGHSVEVRGSSFFIFGGARDGYALDSNVYRFDGETFVWEKLKTKGQPPRPRFNHSCCIARGRLQSLMLVSGGIANMKPERSRRGRAEKDMVLFDLWSLDLTTTSWSNIVMPEGLAPGGMEGHMSCCWDNRDKKVLLFGGSSFEQEEKEGDDLGETRAFEIDLDPSWNVRFRKAKKKKERALKWKLKKG
jgi:hypothetical protein